MSSRFPMTLALLYAWGLGCLVFMSEAAPVSLLLSLLGLLAFALRERWSMSRRNVVLALIGSAVVTGMVWQTSEHGGRLLGAASLSAAVFAACCLISFTVLRSQEETRLAIPGLCGFLLATCTLSTDIRLVALVGVTGTLLLALALRERQGLSNGWRQLPPLLLMAGLTVVLALAAKWSETRASYLLNLFSMIPASGIRFPPSASLNSLQRSSASDVVVLRVYGDTAPPYMVGRTFTDFDNRSFWNWKPTKKEVLPVGDATSPLAPGLTLKVFPNVSGQQPNLAGQPAVIEFPDGGSGFTFYAPRYFSALATDLPRLHRYSDGLWQVLALDSFSGTYCLYPYQDGWVRQGPPEILSQADRARATALPDNLTPEIARLAEEVAGRYSDHREKARRITTFFQTQFEYGYDFPFESEETALEEFLIKRPPAHCEFFATATALMLRAQGVPTRYINGFVVQERSIDDSYYVIRLKHAHAWVEAYLPGQGWTTFDPTPPGVLESPESQNSSRWDATLEWLSNRWRQFVSWFRLSPTEMLGSVRRFLAARSAKEALGLLLLAGAFYGIRSWWRRRGRQRRSEGPSTPFQAGRDERLSPLLDRLQEAVRPAGWRRQPWETLPQWSERLRGSTLDPNLRERLERALLWYAAARYGAQVEASGLEAELEQLRAALEGNSLEARERPEP